MSNFNDALDALGIDSDNLWEGSHDDGVAAHLWHHLVVRDWTVSVGTDPDGEYSVLVGPADLARPTCTCVGEDLLDTLCKAVVESLKEPIWNTPHKPADKWQPYPFPDRKEEEK